MSYAKDYKKTMLYSQRPDIVEALIDLEPGDFLNVKFKTDTEARQMRYRIYGFQRGFYGKRRFCVTIRNNNDLSEFYVHVSHPMPNGELLTNENTRC